MRMKGEPLHNGQKIVTVKLKGGGEEKKHIDNV